MLPIYILTLKEMIKKKVLLVTFVLVAIYLTCYALGLHYSTSVGQPGSHLGNPMLEASVYTQLLGFAIYTGGFISAFLAIFSSAGTIATEVEIGLLQSVIAKPVQRWKVLLGKALGFTTGCVLFNCILLTAILIISNQITGQKVLTHNIPLVYTLFCLQPIPLLSITLLASIFLPAISSGVVGAAAFIISITGGMMGQMGKIAFQNPSLMKVGIITSYLSPMDSIYRRIFTILVPPTFLGKLGPFGAALQPIKWIEEYTLAYIFVCLLLAIWSFQRRDL